MNILHTTDNKFVPQVGVSLCSIFENNKDEAEINAYILGRGISAANAAWLQQLSHAYGRTITLIPLDDMSAYIGFAFDTLGWNPIILARLLLDRFLPPEVERILYLDGDTVNIAPLHELWETDLQGCVLGACIEATCDPVRKAQVVGADRPYINSGVLLIDVKRWREENIGQQIMDYYQSRNGLLFAADQDAINGALLDRIHYLPPRYNFYNIYWFYNYRVLKKLMGNAWYYAPDVYDASVQHPAIIHYLGEERPWREGNRHRFKADYLRYLHKMPPPPEENCTNEQGWQMYFLCWNVFNVLMKPFPMLRYRIINRLIPAVMAWRKKQLRKAKK